MVLVCVVLTDRGADSSTDVDPEAEAVRSPGMAMGSGDRVRVFSTAGASGFPQFFQSKPRTCSEHTANRSDYTTRRTEFRSVRTLDLDSAVNKIK